jgi:outer membrane protein
LISKLSLAQLLQLDDFDNFDVVDDTNVKMKIIFYSTQQVFIKSKRKVTELKIAQTNLEIAEKMLLLQKVDQPTCKVL